MSETYSLQDVRRMGAAQAAGAQSSKAEAFTLDDVERMRDQSARDLLLKRETTDMAYGMRRGLRDAWDTAAELLALGYDKVTGADKPNVSGLVTGKQGGEYARVKAMNDATRAEATAGRPTTPGSVLGYVGGNALATTPILRGGQVALNALGLPALGNALVSGGMKTGRAVAPGVMPRVADTAIRMAGGAGSGYAGAGLADPESANSGAVIGAVLPPALQATNVGFAKARELVRGATMPQQARTAASIAEMAGTNPRNLQELQALRAALDQQGPQIIPGTQTVPEILQSPGVSQLQRSVKAVNPGPFVARDAERELARREVLERIAPIGNRNDVAQEVGSSIAEYAIPAHQAAKGRVSAAFDAVDPFAESRVLLPIDKMQAAKDKFLGPGTFGSGGSAQQAIEEAKRIGTQALPAVRQAPTGRQPQDILQAVRKLGGISPNSAGGMNREIAELARKQTGTTGLVSAKGRTIDEVAELMHERGFISSPDPSELLDAVRGSLSGQRVYGADVADDAFRARLDRSMGDLPQGGSVPKPVTFEELQNLRSSIGEQWRAANRMGNAKEAAALDAQRRFIDETLDNLAAGKGQPGEFFAPDMVKNYKEARALHAAKEQQFKTGPQAGLFRRGSDNLPMIEGAEVPRKFFNANASQVSDAQSFRRLVQDDPQMMAELRRFAVSDAAASASSRNGNLTNAAFNRWLDSRAGAIGETFTPQQRTWLKAIAEDLRRADLAENLGRSTGSDTAQKAASMLRLGLVDNPGARYVAGKIPFGNALMDAVSGSARETKANRLAELLLDPQATVMGLDSVIAARQPNALNALMASPNSSVPGRVLARSAPLLLTGGGN